MGGSAAAREASLTAVVIDASAVSEVLLGTKTGRRVSEELEREDAQLHVPHLLIPEVLSVFRGWLLGKKIIEEAARKAIQRLRQFPLTFNDEAMLAELMWTHRHNLSIYDATYVALAAALRLIYAPPISASSGT